jgi:hypothetical protein
LFELADESLDERTLKVRQAFYAAHAMPDMSEPYIVEVFDDYVICRAGESLYRAAYTLSDGEIAFAPKSEWTEVKPSYVEAALEFIRGLFKRKPAAPPAPPVGGVDMTIKLSELSAEDRAELVRLVAAQASPQAPPPPASPPFVDLSSIFNLDGLSDEAKAERKRQIEAHLSLVRQQANLEYQAQLAQVQRESVIAELATRVTGGTAEIPRGLPGVTAAELQGHLLKLDPAEAKWFGDLLARIVKDGLLEFAELGHGKRLQGLAPVPEFAREPLQAALDAGHSAQAFFELAGLGDAAQYDLSAFTPAKKE